MSHYKEILPDKNLLPLIECYWIRISNDVSDHLVLPDGCIDIVFNDTVGLVVGTMTTPLIVKPSGNFLGVRFRSGKAAMFLNFNASELTDQITELHNIASHEGSNLTEKLFDADDLSKKIKILNTNLWDWLKDKSNDRVDYLNKKKNLSQGNN
jgi:hypothetical protein